MHWGFGVAIPDSGCAVSRPRDHTRGGSRGELGGKDCLAVARYGCGTTCDCTNSEDGLGGINESKDIFCGFVGRFENGCPQIGGDVYKRRVFLRGVRKQSECIGDFVVILEKISYHKVGQCEEFIRGRNTVPNRLLTIKPNCWTVAFPGICSPEPSCSPVSEARRFITTSGTCSGTRSRSCCAFARLDSSSF